MKTVLGVIIAKTIASEYQPLAYFLGYAFACLIGLILFLLFSLLAIKIYHACIKITPKVTSVIRGHSKHFETNISRQHAEIGPKTRDAVPLPRFKLYDFFPLILGWISISALLIAIPLGSHDGKWFSLFHKPSFESDFTDCVERDARKNAIDSSERSAEERIAFWTKQIDISALENNQKISKLKSDHNIFVRQYDDTHPDLIKTSSELLAYSLQHEARLFAQRLLFARERMRKITLDRDQEIAKLHALSTRQYCYERIFESSISGINYYYEHFRLKSTYRQLFHGETKDFWSNILSGAL